LTKINDKLYPYKAYTKRKCLIKGYAMYRHILVPTDGSELSSRAIEYAAALAKAVGAKLTILTVTTPYFGFVVESELAMAKIKDYHKDTEKAAMQYLDVAKDIAATAQVPYEVMHVERTQPYQAIIDAAKDRDCDLIVMASHGRRGMAAIVLGSETVKVLTHSTIPVLVVRPKIDPLAVLKGS
jgi:nucleotide-binding universal stress UspA family protein